MKEVRTEDDEDEIYSHELTKREYKKYYWLGVILGFVIIIIGALLA